MSKICIEVDFNEMLEDDLVLLSKGDARRTADGRFVHLEEGMAIVVFVEDADDQGNVEFLLGEGVVELNRSDESWGRPEDVKWCCRIGVGGLGHSSTLPA